MPLKSIVFLCYKCKVFHFLPKCTDYRFYNFPLLTASFHFPLSSFCVFVLVDLFVLGFSLVSFTLDSSLKYLAMLVWPFLFNRNSPKYRPTVFGLSVSEWDLSNDGLLYVMIITSGWCFHGRLQKFTSVVHVLLALWHQDAVMQLKDFTSNTYTFS
jgi:hypothetical protein